MFRITTEESFSWPGHGVTVEPGATIAHIPDPLMPVVQAWADAGRLKLEEVNGKGEVVRVYDPKNRDFGPTDKTKLDKPEEAADALTGKNLAEQMQQIEAGKKQLEEGNAKLAAAQAKLDEDLKAFADMKKPDGGTDTDAQSGSGTGRRTGTQRGGSGG